MRSRTSGRSVRDVDDSGDAYTGVKGKQGELIVIGELLRRAYKVYTPIVDSGIDCLVDVGEGNYKEIQIKYREDKPIFQARKFKPRDNFFVVCYLSTRHKNELWIIPSRIFLQMGRPAKVGNRDYIQLTVGREGTESYERLREFRDNFSLLLAGASRETQRAVRKASGRVEGLHFKQPDFEREVLIILSGEVKPLASREIVKRLYERLHMRFSTADLERGTDGRTRWEKTARFAIYQGLKKRALIEARTKNQWVITAKGREALAALSLRGR